MIGCHLPISDDIFDIAKSINADIIQIINGPRTFSKIKESRERNPNIDLVTHAKYGINTTTDLKSWMYQVIAKDLELNDQLNGIGTVLHPGSGTYNPKTIASNIMDLASSITHFKSKLIIEGQSSCGNLVVTRTQHMVEIWQEMLKINSTLASEKVAFCLDTCHLCVGKTPIQGKDLYNEFLQFEKEIGIKHLALIHFNDAKVLTADRHQDIFMGYIGNQKLNGDPLNLISVAAWAFDNKVPMIIERDKNTTQSLALQINTMKQILVDGPSKLKDNLNNYYQQIQLLDYVNQHPDLLVR